MSPLVKGGPTTRCSPGRTPGHLPRPQVLGPRLTRLASGKMEGDLPARMRENESTVARAAGRPWTPAPHRRCGEITRTPAHVCLPEGHRDGVRHSAGRPQVLGLRLLLASSGSHGMLRDAAQCSQNSAGTMSAMLCDPRGVLRGARGR